MPYPSLRLSRPVASSPRFWLRPALPGDQRQISALLEAAFGPDRFARTAYRLRGATPPALGLSLVAVGEEGVLASILFTPILVRSAQGPPLEALLLGPVVVDQPLRGLGIGGRLIRLGLAQAQRVGARLVVLIGDPEYYGRFGFSATLTAGWRVPGPVVQRRLLALSLGEGEHPIPVAAGLHPVRRL